MTEKKEYNHGLRIIPFAKIINQRGWLPTQADGKGDYGGGGILKFFRYRGRIIGIDEFTDEIVVDNPYDDFMKVLVGLKEHEEVIPELVKKEKRRVAVKETKKIKGNKIPRVIQNQPHEGEIWRKQGSFDWCRIDRNETPEAADYDGGLPGFAVSSGKFSFKRKRVYWYFLKWFVAASNYDAFVMQMKVEQRYLMRGEVKEQKNEL